jgi:hypothetical protein
MADNTNGNGVEISKELAAKGFIMEEVSELPKAKRQGGINLEFVSLAVKVLKDRPGKTIKLGVFSAPTAQQRKQKLVEKSGLGDELEVSTRTVEETGADGKRLTGVFAVYKPRTAAPVKENAGGGKGKGSKSE